MDKLKEIEIRKIVDSTIRQFAKEKEDQFIKEVDLDDGVINSKKNNFFMAELGEEFIFYSAFVRSFDSSFGKKLEKMGNLIASLSYEVRGTVESFILPQETQHIDDMIKNYDDKIKPQLTDYLRFNCMMPRNTDSFEVSHKTDHYFYKEETNEHFLIELKAGGDLDNKKAKAEKRELLHEYFILKNSLMNSEDDHKIRLFFGTAYNKFGEESEWKQANVLRYFSKDELLIGKDYWNFVCDSERGYEVIVDQYKKSSDHIKSSLTRIKEMYNLS